MKDPRFYNKDGSLTRYSFACGYIQRQVSETRWKEMYMEHEHFHVKSGPVVDGETQCYTTWETFEGDELTKARQLYKKL